jgi:hypothetical protein
MQATASALAIRQEARESDDDATHDVAVRFAVIFVAVRR